MYSRRPLSGKFPQAVVDLHSVRGGSLILEFIRSGGSIFHVVALRDHKVESQRICCKLIVNRDILIRIMCIPIRTCKSKIIYSLVHSLSLRHAARRDHLPLDRVSLRHHTTTTFVDPNKVQTFHLFLLIAAFRSWMALCSILCCAPTASAFAGTPRPLTTTM